MKFLKKFGVFIFLVIFFIVALAAAIKQCSRVISIPSEIIGQGEVSGVEYIQGNLGSGSGTIIRFKDGGSVVLNGMHSIPSGKITVLRGPDGYEIKRGGE